MTTWLVQHPQDLREVLIDAGAYNSQIVENYLRTRPFELGANEKCRLLESCVPAWFYVFKWDPRLLVVTIGQSMRIWNEPAMARVAVVTHLGELDATRHLQGQKGFWMSLFPQEMCVRPYKRTFSTGQHMLHALTWNALD